MSVSSVLDGDLLSGTDLPTLLVIRTPQSLPRLAMTPESGLPDLRVLYLLEPLAEGGSKVTRLLDDPGPVRDHFERLAYERLALVRGSCHGSGCLVATAIERQTPGTSSSAFTMFVTLLDDSRTPLGPARALAQEPDRGAALTACVGASAEGFVLGTAVEGGRGRLLWLDQRATPLDVRYVADGFTACSARRAGLRVQVATTAQSGVEYVDLGGAATSDAGPPAAMPPSPASVSFAALATLGSSPTLLAGTDSATLAQGTSAESRTELFDAQPSWLHAAPDGDGLLVSAVIDGRVAVARLGDDLSVVARSSGLVRARRAWIAPTSNGPMLAWLEDRVLRLRGLSCGNEPRAEEGEDQPLPDEVFAEADRRFANVVRDLARSARSRDQHYRAGWLYERSYNLDTSSTASLRDAAAALTEIRHTQAARRILQRLSELETTEAQSLLRSTCRDSDFERQWRSGEYQRITGCAAPPERQETDEDESEPEGEAPPEDDDQPEGDEQPESDEQPEAQNDGQTPASADNPDPS